MSPLDPSSLHQMGQYMVKQALVGAVASLAAAPIKAVGKAMWRGAGKEMGAMKYLAVPLGAYGMYQALKGGREKSRAYNAGFNPQVQSYLQEPTS